MNSLAEIARKGHERAGEHGVFVHDLATQIDWTYGELDRWTRGLAAALQDAGVEEGDRVAYLTVCDPRFFPLLLACERLGAALVPVNPALRERELAGVFGNACPRVVICDKVPAQADWISIEDLVFPEDSAERSGVTPDPDRAALIIYTSGTTGQSKGVTLTARNLGSMAHTFCEVYNIGPTDGFLCLLPFFHINAPMITGLLPMLAGAKVVLAGTYSFVNARSLFRIADEHQLTVLSLTPSILASQLSLFPHGVGALGGSLRFAMVGTAPLPEDLWRRFEERFELTCYQGYGLTETTTWATMTPPDDRKRYDTVGLPLGAEVVISGPQREILIRGDIVMKGYHAAKKKTRSVLKQGWIHTGDVGVLDPDGQLRVVGRLKNIIKRRGVLVHPENIDAILLEHPGIAAAATVGIADDLAGERVCSAVQWNADHATQATRDEVYAHLRRSLSADALPDRVNLWPTLPRNPVGKPDLAELRSLLSGARATEVVDLVSRYKISRTPPDRKRLQYCIQTGIEQSLLVQIIGYWGVGANDRCRPVDHTALNRLRDIALWVDEALGLARCHLTLLLADVHGRNNGIADQTGTAYLADVGRVANDLGIETRMLSDIWSSASLDPNDAASGSRTPEFDEVWVQHPLRDDLLRQAARRCPPDRSIEDHARRYLWTCLAERPLLTKVLAGQIFFTYGPAAHQALLPELPLLYLHSLKPGVARKPWFDEVNRSQS